MPFQVQEVIKNTVTRHEQICNMKYTQKGKIQFMTRDPIYAVQLLNLEAFIGLSGNGHRFSPFFAISYIIKRIH